MGGERIEWIDLARAISIILVVMMHSTLGVESAYAASGWMGEIVAFAQPFRIPAFFVISGLLLSSALSKPFGAYLEKRVLTLAYLYVVWVALQFAFKVPGMIGEFGFATAVQNYLLSFVQPFGTLWFIYVLPIFFLMARAVQQLPTLPVLAIAMIVHLLPVETGWLVIDASIQHFFFFYVGHVFFQDYQSLAAFVRKQPIVAFAALLVWAAVHGVTLELSTMPGASTLSALIGAVAVIAAASLLSLLPKTDVLTWIGRNTIVVYLGFFLPMAMSRLVLIKTGIITDVGTISMIVTLSALTGSIVMYLLAKYVGFDRYFYQLPISLEGKVSRTHDGEPAVLPNQRSITARR